MSIDVNLFEIDENEPCINTLLKYVPDEKITLIINENNFIELPRKYFSAKNFVLDYATNLSVLQGQEYEKIYLAPDDYDKILEDDRKFYTLISRLKFDTSNKFDDYPERFGEDEGDVENLSIKMLYKPDIFELCEFTCVMGQNNKEVKIKYLKTHQLKNIVHRCLTFFNERDHKYYIFSSKDDFLKYCQSLPLEYRNFHEVIRGVNKQRIKFDIDFEKGFKGDVKAIMNKIIDSIENLINDTYDLIYPVSRWNNICVYEACNKEKSSYHIMIKGFQLATYKEMAYIDNLLRKKLGPKLSKFVDQTHKSNQNFRCLGNVKVDSPSRPFLISNNIENCGTTDKDSFIQFNNDIDLPIRTIEYKKYNHNISQEVNMEDVNKIIGDVHLFREQRGNMLYFNRLKPSYCEHCKRDHDHDNTLMIKICEDKKLKVLCRHYIKQTQQQY